MPNGLTSDSTPWGGLEGPSRQNGTWGMKAEMKRHENWYENCLAQNWGKNAATRGPPKLAHFCAVARPPSEHLRIPPLWPSASVVAVARVLPHCNWPRTTRNPQSANAQYAIRPRTRESASPGSPRGNLQLPPRTLQSPWFWPPSGPKTLHAPSRHTPPWTEGCHTPLRGYENWGMKTGMKTGYENSMVGRCCPIRESLRTVFVTRPM